MKVKQSWPLKLFVAFRHTLANNELKEELVKNWDVKYSSRHNFRCPCSKKPPGADTKEQRSDRRGSEQIKTKTWAEQQDPTEERGEKGCASCRQPGSHAHRSQPQFSQWGTASLYWQLPALHPEHPFFRVTLLPFLSTITLFFGLPVLLLEKCYHTNPLLLVSSIAASICPSGNPDMELKRAFIRIKHKINTLGKSFFFS